jgi:ribosomal protein S18 acetylase RimI-like enzyme
MNITFEPVPEDRQRLLPLLLLADVSETIVGSYIDRGALFAIRDGEADLGVLLLIHEGDAVEVKNLAVAEGCRRQGIGRLAVAFAARWAREAGATRVTVGTANSSLDAIRFYQKAGFRRSGVRRGFFAAYPEPIWEDGIRARDMIMFELPL